MSTLIYNTDNPYETDLYEYNNFSFIYNAVFGYEEPGVEYSGSFNESSTTSTFTSELNRLANGGTYPILTSYLADQGAGNKFSGTSGLGLLAALNLEVSPNRRQPDYKGLNAVCNELAGTVGLSALVALRSIEL
jgi:hypothetical protein